MKAETRRSMLLVAFLAWVGLGADGLSSACYGPETAFLALGNHTHLALYLAVAISLTVFIIALGYNQVRTPPQSGGLDGQECPHFSIALSYIHVR